MNKDKAACGLPECGYGCQYSAHPSSPCYSGPEKEVSVDAQQILSGEKPVAYLEDDGLKLFLEGGGGWQRVWNIPGGTYNTPVYLKPLIAAEVPASPIHEEGGEWYFYDETGADRYGPYPTEQTARHKLALYGIYLDIGPEAYTAFLKIAYDKACATFHTDGSPRCKECGGESCGENCQTEPEEKKD